MRILVVDDSIVFRSAISDALSEVADIEVVAKLKNGQECVDFLEKDNSIDLITLDMEMPVLDGIQTIEAIRKTNRKVIIICFSGLTRSGAAKTMEALTMGANDFVTKAAGTLAAGGKESISVDLLTKIDGFRNKVNKNRNPKQAPVKPVEVKKNVTSNMISVRPRAIVIGSSTGGPNTLKEIFSKINVKMKVPLFLAQHMPPVFTAQLAEALDGICSHIKFVEAKDGDIAEAGYCYIAPGDYHMVLKEINGQVIIKLNQSEKVCFVRPAVDVLFNSAVPIYKDRLAAIILTGMGQDGMDSCKEIYNSNGQIYIQDEETSVVWGMPGAVARSGVSYEELPLAGFSELISNLGGGVS